MKITKYRKIIKGFLKILFCLFKHYILLENQSKQLFIELF